MKFRHLKIILLISLSVAILVLLLNFINSDVNAPFFASWDFIGISLFYTTSLTVVNTYFFVWLEQKVDWKTRGKVRFIVGVCGSIILTLIAFAFCRLIHLTVIDPQYTFVEFWKQEGASHYVLPFFIAAIISLSMHALYFYKAVQEYKVTEQKIIAGTASAKFDALKNQLDPHFLFNSLNVLTALIEENPELAQKFTASLSKVYRYVLEQKSKELVSVIEEIAFAKTYLNLLKMRFEDSIICELPTHFSNPEAKIVPLSLQLLLENAVKHNVVSEEHPLHISITEENGFLIVKNNLQKKNVLKKSAGVGLQNILQRYQILTSREVIVERFKKTFEVRLPLLTRKVTIDEEENTPFADTESKSKLAYATERVKKQRGFYGNLTSFLIIMPCLFLMNFLQGGMQFPWVIFPFFGWGIGLIFHYMSAFDHNLIFGKNWEKRKIKEFMNKDNFKK